MSDAATKSELRRRALLATWISVSVIAVAGVVFAVVASSWFPLVLLLGLALPMIPVGSFRRSSR